VDCVSAFSRAVSAPKSLTEPDLWVKVPKLVNYQCLHGMHGETPLLGFSLRQLGYDFSMNANRSEG
jgi:hypothetical protein